MVNNTNPYVEAMPHLPQPPLIADADHSDRRIGVNPLWDMAEIVEVASRCTDNNVTVRMVTNRAERDYENLEVNGFSLQQLLLAVESEGIFKESVWCRTSPRRGQNGRTRGTGSWVPCDSYVVSLNYEHPTTGYNGVAEYYIKMCMSLNGSVVLFVSLHV